MSLSNDVFLPALVFDVVNYVACKLKRNSIFFFFCNFFDKCYLKVAHSRNVSRIKILVNFKMIVHKGKYILYLYCE